MEKFLIEIFGVYGKSDADTKIESFVINSIDELEEAMEGYEWLCSDDGKSDYERFIKGEISSASFPHWVTGTNPIVMKSSELHSKRNLKKLKKSTKIRNKNYMKSLECLCN